LTQGISLVLRGFQDTADRIGLRRVESVGTRFDPGKHEAWQHTETDEHEMGTVIAEFEPGYLLGTRLLRPAKVAVARPRRAVAAPELAHDPDADLDPEDPNPPPADIEDSEDEAVLFIEDEAEAGEDTPSDDFEENGGEA